MKPHILLTQALHQPIEDALDAQYHVHRLHRSSDPEGLLKEMGPCIRGVITGGALGITTAVMDRLPRLEIVAIHGIGTDAVDLAYARARGIHVTTTPDVLTADVADMAMGLLIATARGLCTGDRFVRERQWGKAGLPLATRVTGKRIGIVGLGRVGRAIASRAQAFGMPIAYHDRCEFTDLPYRFYDNLAQLAQESEVLVLAASADNARPIIDLSILRALGKDGILINVARGRLVNEPDLVQALQEGIIAGAGLDVFADEPHVPEALFAMENVVLQPHRASATRETRLDMGHIVLDALASVFSGRRPPTSVTS